MKLCFMDLMFEQLTELIFAELVVLAQFAFGELCKVRKVMRKNGDLQ